MSHYDCPCMEKCPLHYAMSVIGGKWKVQIVCALTNAGALRYNALRAKLDGISNTVLAASLRELETDGLVVRTVYPESVSGGARPGGVPSHGGLPLPAAHSGAIERLGRGPDDGATGVKRAIVHK